MSDQVPPSTADRYRLRLRFRKSGDLRWISHRDLVRVMERLCRRANLQLRMSEGFHPKPKMSFPSALALGIAGHHEVMEMELVEPIDPRAIHDALAQQAPEGLTICQVESVDAARGKCRVRSMTYEFPVPHERRLATEQAIARLRASENYWIQRDTRSARLDLLADLESLDLVDSGVRFRLRAVQQASARPRDVLQAVGLADLEQQGSFLTRSEVEVAP